MHWRMVRSEIAAPDPSTHSRAEAWDRIVAYITERSGGQDWLYAPGLNGVQCAMQWMDSLQAAPSATTAPVAELARLREIEHRVWHLLDDSEERTDEVAIFAGADLDALLALIPEDHPAIDAAKEVKP